MRVIHENEPPIRLAGLSKSFGTLNVLDGLDLEFRPGETTAVIGPNGAGKTTMIKSILGLVKPSSGEIRVLGESVADGHTYREHIGYMPQAPAFPENLSGREVIGLLHTFRHRRGAAELELLRRFGLDGELDKPVRTLSGGTRQKLSAVLAFMFEPAILILDEPTAGLDPVASAALKDYVHERAEAGATVVLTSHVMADLEELCDRVVFLMDGRSRFDGPLDALRATTGETRLERAIAQLLQKEVA
ncbi:MAG: ABC transporter ATP-binding protein [Rhodothermales bacterium]|nr:ABC transporter ATP-binding protein [Rhodothermales bacterium]